MTHDIHILLARGFLAVCIGVLLVISFFLLGMAYIFSVNHVQRMDFKHRFDESGTVHTGTVVDKEENTEQVFVGPGRGARYHTYRYIVVRFEADDIRAESESARIEVGPEVFAETTVGESVEVLAVDEELRLAKELALLSEPTSRATLARGLAALAAALFAVWVRSRVRVHQ